MTIPIDKQLHFLTGGYLFMMVSLFASYPLAMVITIVAGIGKEVYDHFHRDKHSVEAPK